MTRTNPSPTQTARRALRAHLREVVRRLRSIDAISWTSIDAVHKLRVATRRADAALVLFHDWLPRRRAASLRKRLRKIRSAAGVARDLDLAILRLVEQAQTAPHDAIAPLLHRAALERAAVQPPLLAACRTGRSIAERTDELLKRLEWRGDGAEPAPPDLIRTTLEALLRELGRHRKALGRGSRKYHPLRIVLKRLRYSLELFDEWLPRSLARSLAERLRAMQDRLGDANDAETALAFLQDWLKPGREARREPGREAAKPAESKRWLARIEHDAEERLQATLDDLPQELDALVTQLRQLVPAASSSQNS